MRHFSLLSAIWICICILPTSVIADETEKIFSFIERTCGAGEAGGTRISVTGKGVAKLSPSSLLKILADSGVELDGNVSLDSVKGLVKEANIKDDQKERRQCRKELLSKILPALVDHMLNPTVTNITTSDSVSSGFVFDARTLKPGSWLDEYDFMGFDAIGHNGIINQHGFTSDSDKSIATFEIRGFNLSTSSKVEILMNRCKGCEIELRNRGGLVTSAVTGGYGTHGNTINFQTQGKKNIGGKKSTHVFEITEKGVRLTSNGKFVGVKRVQVDRIDQIVIRGLKREHPYIGRSYVFQVSATKN